MKAVVNTSVNRLEMLDLPMPEPGARQVRIRTAACGICPTDLEMISGWKRTSFPATPGHEWSGIVDAVGPKVPSKLVGSACVAENVLTDGGEVGFEHPGAYGQYFLTEADNIILLPTDFDLICAALVEPLAVCVRATKKLQEKLSDPVLILGDGTIGLLMLAMLKLKGAQDITIVGGSSKRLKLAHQWGASVGLNFIDFTEDYLTSLRARGHDQYATIIEASGAAEAINAALALVAKLGKIMCVASYGELRAGFLWHDLLIREFELLSSNASAGAWPEAVHLAASGQVPLDQLVSHVLPAEKFQEGINLVQNSKNDLLKVILEWR
jgi:2-desacetyl-2-hydroxyethyl bacteriochlorophyllide A dehydrogenase